MLPQWNRLAHSCVPEEYERSRMQPVQGGAVLLDGIDVRDLQQGSLRGAVAVVPQVLHHASSPL